MKLTVAEQRAVAQNANFYFDCYFGAGTGDSVIITGDGVDDLDRLLAILSAGTQGTARFQCDVGCIHGGQGMGYYSSYRPFDIQDVQAIKQFYIGWYGTVAKPDAYVDPR